MASASLNNNILTKILNKEWQKETTPHTIVCEGLITISSYKYLSVHPFSFAYPIQSHSWAGAHSSCHKQWGGVHLG